VGIEVMRVHDLRERGIDFPMRRKDRLLAKARNNPNSLRFREFETILSQCGWTFDHQTGSHRIWYSPQGYRLPIQPKERGTSKGISSERISQTI